MSEPTRVYTNGVIDLEWRPELCCKSHNCHRGLPAVFKPNEQPWVDMSAATTEEIEAQAAQCPLKALLTKRK